MLARVRISFLFSFLLAATSATDQVAHAEPLVRGFVKIVAGRAGFPDALRERSVFGWSIEALGDLDGDGAVEAAIGVPFDGNADVRTGAVWLVEFDPNGQIRQANKIGGPGGAFAGTLENGDRFGLSVALVGDIDGDGVHEFAVGAPGDDDGGPNTGAVYLLSITGDGRIVRRQKISPRHTWTRSFPWNYLIPESVQGGLNAEVPAGELFGMSVETLGDLDGDGIPELAVGSADEYDAGGKRGGFRVLFLRADGTVRRQVRIDGDSGDLDSPLAEYDLFATGMAAPGDLDGDGIPDLAVGAAGDDDACTDCGAVYVLYMRADGRVRESKKITAGRQGFRGERSHRNDFGIALSALPGAADGTVQLAVGARSDPEAGDFVGAVWLLDVAADATVTKERKVVPGRDGFAVALDEHDLFGAGVALLEDLSGGGARTLLVGAEGDDDAGKSAGAVWVLFVDPE